MSNSKQMWYIIGAIVIVVLLAWAVMSGSFGSTMSSDNADQQATTTDTSATGGSGATGTGAGKLPAGWPADAPALQAGAKITYSGATNPRTKAVGPTIEYTVTGTTVQNSITFFKSQFTAKGWTFRGQGEDLGSLMLAATKDTRRFSVSILETHPGTMSVTLQVLK